MIGAIVGDIIGSPYEFKNIDPEFKDNFKLFLEHSRFTDDTVHTIALADAIMNSKDWIDTLHEYYDRYPDIGYGGMFIDWASNKKREAYNSWGNGAPMRVSSVPWLYDGYDVISGARKSARVTHNHMEGIKGAEALSTVIYLCLNGCDKLEIHNHIHLLYYNIPNIHKIHKEYQELLVSNRSLLCSCEKSVPQAIRCFLDAESFEESIRLAVSIGGDSDTVACMTGSIAEAYYGIPPEIEEQALSYLDKDLLKVVNQFKKQRLI